MKKSTEVVAKKDNMIWSWVLSLSSALFSADSSPPSPDKLAAALLATLPVIIAPISLKRFLKLPDDLVREIMSYFSLSEREDLLAFKVDKSLSLFKKNLHAELNVEHLIDRFIYLMTLDGPKNQYQVFAMLKKYSQLTPVRSFLMVEKR